MSEVKVNKISPRTNCGTVTLGDSGDSFVIPSGATITNNGTQTGFGRTGTVDWQTGSIKTTGFTAVSGKGYFCNTDGGAFTATLPASPSAGDIVAFADYTGNFNIANLTIGRNSSKIEGFTEDALMTINRESKTLVYVDGTQGWLPVNDNAEPVAEIKYIAASGGCISTCGDYKIHKFLSPNTFTVTCAGNSAGSNTVSYLVVAGGGGGGGNDAVAGGGAGGFREGLGLNDSYTGSPLRAPTGVPVTATGYPITVGGGGAGHPASPSPDSRGTNGNPSIFSSITATAGGGGAGGPGAVPICVATGKPGGSGGGGGTSNPNGPPNGRPGGTGNTPPVSPPQGNGGGKGSSDATTYMLGGGGGGATAAAADVPFPNPPTGTGGVGGAGATTEISASPVAYAGGGGGGGHNAGPRGPGAGGTGGGGAGGKPGAAVAGGTNTGGGGGGGGDPGIAGAAGGSGIVIIRYKYQ
jgi:hypothetical protein